MNLRNEFIYIAALRYALTRETYAVGLVSDEIKKHLDEFSLNFLKVAIEDVRDRPYIKSTDDEWKDFYKYLTDYFKKKYN